MSAAMAEKIVVPLARRVPVTVTTLRLPLMTVLEDQTRPPPPSPPPPPISQEVLHC